MSVESSQRLLDKEISKITSSEIRSFVVAALGMVDEKFWLIPASSSGKYHPPEDNGEGGLVRHVTKGVAVVQEYARRARFSPLETDLGIAAFLLHDSCKNGLPPWTSDFTDYTHGMIASTWLEQFRLSDSAAKQPLLDAVRYHMAPWCYAVNPYQDRRFSKKEMLSNAEELQRALVAPSRIELSVREADYWSSRPTMSFFPGVSTDISRILHDTPSEAI
jgi:hypothetical protein